MSVEQYEHYFYELKGYVRIGDDETMIVHHFIRGLNDRISGDVWVFEPKTMEAVVAKARLVEEKLARDIGGHTRL